MRIVLKFQQGLNIPPKTIEEYLKRTNRVLGLESLDLYNLGKHFQGNYLITNLYGDSSMSMVLSDILNGKLNFENIFYTNDLPETAKEEGIPQLSDGRFRTILVHNNYGSKEIYPGNPEWTDYYNRIKYRTDELFKNK